MVGRGIIGVEEAEEENGESCWGCWVWGVGVWVEVRYTEVCGWTNSYLTRCLDMRLD